MASQLLELDEESIAAYNNHGAALVTALQQADVAPSHHPVILGMFAVYSILISLGHLSEDDIVWPPYTLEQFDPQQWLDAGLDAVVVAILALLPYPAAHYNPGSGLKWEIAPEAGALSYLGPLRFDQDRERDLEWVEQRCIDFVGNDLVRPNHLRLTDGRLDGTNYIYDTSTGKILILHMFTYNYDGSGTHGPSYINEPFFPAKEVMRNWVCNIYNLLYVPWRFEEGRPMQVVPGQMEFDASSGARLYPSKEQLSAYMNDPTWADGTISKPEARLVYANHVLSMVTIYRAHGWPDNFDREACLSALEQYHEDYREYDGAIHAAAPYSEPGEYIPEQDAPRAALVAFVEKSAGDLAIRKVTRDEL